MGLAVVTGASRGIGSAITRTFLDADYKVIGTSRTGEITINSPNLEKISLDLSLWESIRRATEKIRFLTKRIDVLVNNAGIILDPKDDKISIEKLRNTLEVNLIGTVNFTEQLLDLLDKNSQIVNIISTYGSLVDEIDDETSSAYRISKAALNMYTKTLAFRLKPKGIIVSAFDPGWVKTEMGYAVSSEDAKPDREPEEPAKEILNLINKLKITETGKFWLNGKERGW